LKPIHIFTYFSNALFNIILQRLFVCAKLFSDYSLLAFVILSMLTARYSQIIPSNLITIITVGKR